jgi:kinesin family protein 6/9
MNHHHYHHQHHHYHPYHHMKTSGHQVIVALHQVHKGGRSHVPYRNSLLTLFLKDSLGGNCKTVMVATLSMEQAQAPETISTCRFAQTVAIIPNSPSINEEFDPHAEIKRLKVP